MQDTAHVASYWRKNIQILATLLLVWFVVSYGLGILLVEQLNEYHLGGFPLGFWFAQQGSIYVFIVLILVYAILLDRLETRFSSAAATRDEEHDKDNDEGNVKGEDQEDAD
jgi:putative solute:sodium symporter small subunit